MVAGSRGPGPGKKATHRTRADAESFQPATDPVLGGGAEARRRAALAAGHRGAAAAAAALIDDPDPAVRATALGAVVRASGLTPAVLRLAGADPDPAVRRRACEEIGRALGPMAGQEKAAATPDVVGTAVTVLRAALDDPDEAVTEAAAWATGEAGARGAGSVPALCRIAGEHRAALCREAAVAALGAIGDSRGLDAVLGALDDRPAVRRRAALSLAAFDDPRADEGLRRCAGDRDWQVRQVAEELLRRE